MTRPIRLQLSRKRGFNLQELSREANGLEAVNVARPSKWGNPYRAVNESDRAAAVEKFRRLFSTSPSRLRHMALAVANGRPGFGEAALLDMKLALPELRGRNLACWCSLPAEGEPDICHAAVLLEIANREDR
jgi:hypothetical protein